MKAKENGQMEEFRKKLMEELNRKLGKDMSYGLQM